MKYEILKEAIAHNKTNKFYMINLNIAIRMNRKLNRGRVTVSRTDNISKYCNSVSIELDDELFNAIHGSNSSDLKKILFDTIYTVDGREYYIEPYNKYLLNITLL